MVISATGSSPDRHGERYGIFSPHLTLGFSRAERASTPCAFQQLFLRARERQRGRRWPARRASAASPGWAAQSFPSRGKLFLPAHRLTQYTDSQTVDIPAALLAQSISAPICESVLDRRPLHPVKAVKAGASPHPTRRQTTYLVPTATHTPNVHARRHAAPRE